MATCSLALEFFYGTAAFRAEAPLAGVWHRFVSHPFQQVIPRASQGEPQPCHHVDAGLFLARFERLEVAMADVGPFCQRFLGHAPLHAQAHEVASQEHMSGSGGHPASMTSRLILACDL